LNPKSMQFYVYRAENEQDYTNDALMGVGHSLQGVLWYLHNRVVLRSCPRSLGITRIVRLRATVFNTFAPWDLWEGQFGPFVNFSHGQCVSGDCTDVLSRYKSSVGCQTWQPYLGGESYGNMTQWYSLPGSCPTKPFPEKTATCIKEEPGGQCRTPNGTRTCTWNLEAAGEVSLDELSGINDYASFCTSGGIEFDERTDRGRGCAFWDRRGYASANAARADDLRTLFRKRYPGTELPEPNCDSQYAMCKHHPRCADGAGHPLQGDCCPAQNGKKLDCCS